MVTSAHKARLLVLRVVGAFSVLSYCLVLPASAVPVATLGHSGDSWEGQLTDDPVDKQRCSWVRDGFVALVPPPKRGEAIAMLERTPIVVLDDREGANLLDMNLGNQSVAAAGLTIAIAKMEEQRSAELDRHKGSWSEQDQIDLDQLKTIRLGPQMKGFKAILVRALSQDNLPLPQDFAVQSCGDVVRIGNSSVGPLHAAPARFPLVVFLDFVPKSTFVYWGSVE